MPRSPEFDYSSEPQMSIYEEQAHYMPEVEAPEPAPIIEPVSYPTPESARPTVERQEEEDSFAFDRIDAQGQTTNIGTRERAGVKDADDTEREEIRETRRRLAKNPRRKPQPSRRGMTGQKMSNADGPPPHIPDSRKTY